MVFYDTATIIIHQVMAHTGAKPAHHQQQNQQLTSHDIELLLNLQLIITKWSNEWQFPSDFDTSWNQSIKFLLIS